MVLLVEAVLLQVQLKPPAQSRQRHCLGRNTFIDSLILIPWCFCTIHPRCSDLKVRCPWLTIWPTCWKTFSSRTCWLLKIECDNLVDEFDNTEECVIDFIDGRIIKIIWSVRLIRAHNCCDLNWGIYMICHEIQKIDWVRCVLVCVWLSSKNAEYIGCILY